MGRVDAKLAELGIVLPKPLVLPSPNRTSAVQVGTTLYVSGHGAALLEDGSVRRRGKVDVDITADEASATARALAIKMIATVRHHVGDLDRIRQVVRLMGMVNCTPDFELMPKVIDGASDLYYELFGPERGRHARAAVGMASLPRQQPVEISGEFEVTDL